MRQSRVVVERWLGQLTAAASHDLATVLDVPELMTEGLTLTLTLSLSLSPNLSLTLNLTLTLNITLSLM